jgi:hypothetical protein
LVCFEKILFVTVVSIPVRNSETNRKNCFLVSQTNQKTTKTDWVSVCFGSNQKIFFIVSRTPYSSGYFIYLPYSYPTCCDCHFIQYPSVYHDDYSICRASYSVIPSLMLVIPSNLQVIQSASTIISSVVMVILSATGVIPSAMPAVPLAHQFIHPP